MAYELTDVDLHWVKVNVAACCSAGPELLDRMIAHHRHALDECAAAMRAMQRLAAMHQAVIDEVQAK